MAKTKNAKGAKSAKKTKAAPKAAKTKSTTKAKASTKVKEKRNVTPKEDLEQRVIILRLDVNDHAKVRKWAADLGLSNPKAVMFAINNAMATGAKPKS